MNNMKKITKIMASLGTAGLLTVAGYQAGRPDCDLVVLGHPDTEQVDVCLSVEEAETINSYIGFGAQKFGELATSTEK